MIRAALAATAIAATAVIFAPVAAAEPYPNCTVARQNGDTDIPSSSPKYGPHLDRDGDGIGCESS